MGGRGQPSPPAELTTELTTAVTTALPCSLARIRAEGEEGGQGAAGALPVPPAAAAAAGAQRGQCRVVLVTGFESFNVDLYKQVRPGLKSSVPLSL